MVQMDVRVITLLYWMTQLFHCSTDIADVCPLTSFCSDRQQGGNISHQSNSCCFPCSCHKNCKLVGTCCHDAEKDDRLQYMYPCASQAEIYSRYLSVRSQSSSASNVRVITDCHNFNEDVSNGTLSRCRNAHYLEDLVFVTGKLSGITYINRHCALCNGEDDVDVWNLYMVFRDADTLFSINASFEARDEYILRTGSVMSIPPTEFSALSTFCYKYTLGFCNFTGKWEEYNKDILDKCNHYNSVYFETRRGRFYKNPFCYVCNSSPKDADIQKVCGNLLRMAGKGASEIPMTTLIMTTRNVPTVSRQGCSLGETMNLFTGKCSKLLCQPGTVADGDRCKPLFEEDHGIIMFVSFFVVTEENTTKDQLNEMDILKELRKQMVSKVKKYGSKCDYCCSQFTTINEDLVFSISFISSRGCSYLLYLEIIDSIYKETPIKTLRNISLYGGKFADDFTRTTKPFLVEFRKSMEGMCSRTIQFNDKITPCPSILISMSDLEVLSLKQRTRDEIQRIGTDIGNGTLRVCLEEYNKIYAQSSSSVASYMTPILVTLKTLCFTIIMC